MPIHIKDCFECLQAPELETGKYPYERFFRLRCLNCGERTQSHDELRLVADEWNDEQDSEINTK